MDNAGRALMRAFGGGWELYIPVAPVPAARPRVGRWGTYYPKTYQRYMREMDDTLLPLLVGSEPTSNTVHVSVHVVAAKPKAGKLSAPIGDIDNYMKAALDAVTKSQIIWRDDKQIVTAQGTKRYAVPGERPHTLIRVSTNMEDIWIDEPLAGLGEDVYDLPPSMRVSLDWLREQEAARDDEIYAEEIGE